MIPVAGFALGFALARANSCTVASTRRLVLDYRIDWMFGLGVLISWAGLTLLAFSVFMPSRVMLPPQIDLGLPLAIGAVLLGAGATLNRGCFLGSVSLLARGNGNYLFTLAGILFALSCAEQWASTMAASGILRPDVGTVRLARSAWPAMFWFFPFAIYGARKWVATRKQTMLALIVVGISGGALYAFNPGWSYTSGLERAANGQLSLQHWQMEANAVALFCGAVTSSALRHRFRWERPSIKLGAGCFFGGMLMGFGAKLIPGGNDGLMLWAIPGLTVYGPVAYFIMIATIAILLQIMARRGMV